MWPWTGRRFAARRGMGRAPRAKPITGRPNMRPWPRIAPRWVSRAALYPSYGPRSKLAEARCVAAPGLPIACQPACKPGSVWRRSRHRRVTAIPLERRLPGASSNLPGRQDPDIDPGTLPPPKLRPAPRRPYVVLLPVGFTVPLALPSARCALAAPFHPCRSRSPGGRRCGGLFSVALSLGSPPPDVIRHRMSMEPGLSSPPTQKVKAGQSGRPAG
jgi:hypothetical protein